MKKRLVTTTLAVALGFSSLGALPVTKPIEAHAATVNVQNNQQAVNAKADELTRLAKSLIGKATYSQAEYKKTYPYKFSCATFLNYIFEKSGVDLATYNEDYMVKQGTYVPKSQLQKGDLVFFRSKTTGTDPDHVAMYIGDNKVIHMADSKQNIIIADMNSKPYYTQNYYTARRVLPTLLPANPATKGDKIVTSAYNLVDKAKMGSVNDPGTSRFTKLGFLNYVYKQNGIDLGTTSISELMKKGTTVSRSSLKKGDIVFFSGTIGSKTPTVAAIYAGDQRLIVPDTSKLVTRVILFDWYNQRYITAKRF